jgi:phosphate transport system substrate-binding protein
MYLRVLVILLIGLVSPVSAEMLHAGGVGAATKLLPVLFAAFDRNQGIELEVIPSLGSNGGLRALSENVLDIAVAGRLLNADEIKQGMRIVAAIRTPFVLVTSHPNPNGLKSTEIADIFKAQKATWADGSLIRIILRPKSDSDTPILGAMFPGMVPAIEAARARQDIAIAATDQDNADAAEHMKGSLAGSTLTQIKTEQRNLRLITIDGVAPSLAGLENDTYPFGKTIYFVLPPKNNPAADRFIALIQSSTGQALLRETGNVMVANPGRP